MAEAFNSLFKWELIYPQGPWKGLDDVEYATMGYLDWFNHRRLHGEITEDNGSVTPAEFEAAYTAFVLRVAATYSSPPAFFLSFGPMRFEYEPSVLRVLAGLQAAGVAAHAINYTLGHACGCGHPSAADAAQMAAIAAPVIAQALKWDLPPGF